ncbi:MAG TPA: polymer-forming cytoskeletal protein [Caulobacteraceae bacterium]|jgi:cytoskeletal protein CcmA (bactofilin family)
MFNKSIKDTALPPAGGPTPGGQAPQAPAPAPAPGPDAAQNAAAQQQRRPQQITASVLGSDLVIKGGIEGRGEIQLQGRAWGDVKVERLIVGDAAELEGSVDAVMVEIRGRVAGSITARQVRLLPTARVEGDITYEQLSIELGAQFEGRCIRSKAAAAAAPTPLPKAAAAPQPADEFSDEAFGAPASGGAPATGGPAPAPAPTGGDAKPVKAV